MLLISKTLPKKLKYKDSCYIYSKIRSRNLFITFMEGYLKVFNFHLKKLMFLGVVGPKRSITPKSTLSSQTSKHLS